MESRAMAARKKAPFVKIEGQEVPWSVIQMVRRACGGDWDQTMDAFWKARDAKGPNSITRYAVKGLVPDPKTGMRYSLIPSFERENGQMETIRKWWAKHYTPSPKSDAVSVRDVFKMLAAGME